MPRASRLDQVRWLGAAADLPLRAIAAAPPKQGPNLLEGVVDLLGAEPLTLDGVPALPGPQAEGEALGLDSLAVRPDRAERVRVFGDLAEHPVERTQAA